MTQIEGTEQLPSAGPVGQAGPSGPGAVSGRLEGHGLGDGWPQQYWRSLAAECDYHGFARPVVKFLEFLGELRTADQLVLARNKMRSLSAEHLATVAGQVGGALLTLKRAEAPGDLVDAVTDLYRSVVSEMEERARRGEFPQPPNPSTRLRFGWRQPDGWREFHDWIDLVS